MEMMGFDASPPEPVVVNLGQHRAPKKRMRYRLLEFIIFVATLAVIFLLSGALRLLYAEGPNSLHDALRLNKYDEAIELIRLGGDMNAMNADGELPLVLAADDSSADAYDVVRELILAGARVNETDGESYTALHKAAYRGNLAVADLLLRHGADINAVRVLQDFLRRAYGHAARTGIRAGKVPGSRVPDESMRSRHS